MRVTLPKVDKNGDEPDVDDYQTGYVPPQDGGAGNGDDGNDERKKRRGLALGCLLFVVVIAAAIVAFMALNHTTKKPIEDPYEYVEPDTTSVDTIPEDTVQEVVDTVEVHEEKPKAKVAPVDTVAESSDEATDESDVAAPSDESTTESSDKSSTKSASSKDKSTKDKSSKDKSSKDKSSKDNTTKE